ncbi:hypothetical protein WR25_20307 [Diploscapter pachys]|uniref:TRAF1-6 MATH domain-containing protein n=1 Tax=Diploscapter pachys TaxID=2018661 RepID=A0A2A2LPI7_9BILA|nr:hypothetical protein WR25_20307 [Diploscapter pachys]
MKGEYDGILQWPFRMMVKITLIDQKPKIEDRINVSFTIDPRMLNDSAQFLHRPISERNASFGAQTFCSLEILESYMHQDAMFVKFEVFPIAEAELLGRNMEKSEKKKKQHASPVVSTNYQDYP